MKSFIVTVAALALSAAAHAQDKDWRAITERDIDFAAGKIATESIGAVHPDPAAFSRRLRAARDQAHAEARLVRDAEGHRAVIQHFVGAFQDAHLRVGWKAQPTEARWPGFVLRYRNGSYSVAGSQVAGVADGQPVTACDGKPVQALIDRFVDYEVGLPAGLDAIRVTAGSSLLVDTGNPFLTAPSACVIGGRSVKLDWRVAPMIEIDKAVQSARTRREPIAAIRPFGANGAWVKLGYFSPSNREQADAFAKVIADAPGLRDKDVIVIDVRGNGGGPYNWFMGFLRGLYGQPYADHYAVARLQISGVYRVTPEILSRERKGNVTSTNLGEPADPPMNSGRTRSGREEAIRTGAPFYRAPRPAPDIGPATPNPVRGRVMVLTDTACGSACIAFVDELKLFPGVIQIGWPTYVDSRTGTPYAFDLPSGTGAVRVPTMTRDGRVRDDNVAQIPDLIFKGDIDDTRAVEAWIDEVAMKAKVSPATPGT